MTISKSAKRALGPHYHRRLVSNSDMAPFYATDVTFSKTSVKFRIGKETTERDRFVCFKPDHIKLQSREAELSVDQAFLASSNDQALLDLLGGERMLIAWIPGWLINDRQIGAKQIPRANP